MDTLLLFYGKRWQEFSQNFSCFIKLGVFKVHKLLNEINYIILPNLFNLIPSYIEITLHNFYLINFAQKHKSSLQYLKHRDSYF